MYLERRNKMDANTLNARIEAANEKYVDDEVGMFEGNHAAEEEALSPRPAVDVYNLQMRSRLNEKKRQRPNGAKPRIKSEVEYVVNGGGTGGLKQAYNIAKSQAEALNKRGDTLRAKMLMEQYMEEKFMPSVEALVRLTSADDVMNSSDALKELDSLVLTVGGNTAGFTRSFVEQLYQQELGTTMPSSDGHITGVVRRINDLIENDQVRTAVGLATKTLAQIESGQHSADDSDYSLLLKVAERGQ